MRLFVIEFIIFVVSILCCCNDTGIIKQSKKPDVVYSKIYDNIEIGMTMERVREIMQPLVPTRGSVPCLVYEDDKGFSYYFAFFELESAHTSGKLTAVIFYPKKFETPVYILPKHLNSQPAKMFEELENIENRRRMRYTP